MRFHNNIAPQVRRRRNSLGWSQSMLAITLQLAGFDISRSGVSKIEARLRFVDDKDLMHLAEVLKVPTRDAKARVVYPISCRSWETTRF
jgi:transcriptional regulator with XRE-family HTH domain